MAGNPETSNMVVSVPSVSSFVIKETLSSFSKVSTPSFLIIVSGFEGLLYYDLIPLFILSSFLVLSLLDPIQMLTCSDLILSKQSVLLDLLRSFQPKKVSDIAGMQSLSSTREIDCLYEGVYTFLEGVLDVGMVSIYL